MNYVPLSLLACSLLLSVAAAGQKKEIYVSPQGNDAHPGTAAQPLRTPQKALQMAQNNVRIVLRKGRYYLDSALRITGGNITIEGQNAVISGATPLSLTRKPWKDGIYRADVLERVRRIDQLITNNEHQVLARYPNYDSTAKHYHGIAPDVLDPQRSRKWQHPAGGYVHALHKAEWAVITTASKASTIRENRCWKEAGRITGKWACAKMCCSWKTCWKNWMRPANGISIRPRTYYIKACR